MSMPPGVDRARRALKPAALAPPLLPPPTGLLVRTDEGEPPPPPPPPPLPVPSSSLSLQLPPLLLPPPLV
jgi:hypothetical protein